MAFTVQRPALDENDQVIPQAIRARAIARRNKLPQ